MDFNKQKGLLRIMFKFELLNVRVLVFYLA